MYAEEIVRWVLECRHAGGGFGGSPRHDPHLLYTLSALQILALYDRLDAINADETAACESLTACEQACCEAAAAGAWQSGNAARTTMVPWPAACSCCPCAKIKTDASSLGDV